MEVHRFQSLLIAVGRTPTRALVIGVAVVAPDGLSMVSKADEKRWEKHVRKVKPCGTVAAYKRGCRCLECKAANAVYWRATHPPAPGQDAYGPVLKPRKPSFNQARKLRAAL